MEDETLPKIDVGGCCTMNELGEFRRARMKGDGLVNLSHLKHFTFRD